MTARAQVDFPDASLGCTTVYLRSRAPLLAGTALWLNGSANAECASAELPAIWCVPYSQYAQCPGSFGRRVAAETADYGVFVASEMGHTSSLEGAARGGIAAAEAVLRGAAGK